MTHARLFQPQTTTTNVSPLHHYEILTKANLLEWRAPEDRFPLILGSLLTLGDLHANTIKLIHFLLIQNVIEISASAYDRLIQIYYKHAFDPAFPQFPRYTKAEVAEFKHILETEIHLNTALDTELIKNKLPLILRFIGDMFADRGYGDLLTMFVLMRLVQLKLNFRIVLSNHDILLISAFILGQYNMVGDPPLTPEQEREFIGSYLGVLEMIIDGIITNAEFKEMIEKYFLPYLILVDYTAHPITNKLQAVFCHGRAGLQSIHDIARVNGGSIEFKSPASIPAIIEEMNEKFEWHKTNNTLNIYTSANLSIVKSRTYKKDDTPLASPTTRFGHGHADGQFEKKTDYPNETNLDDSSGRGLGSEAQLYHALYEGPTPYVLKNKTSCLEYTRECERRAIEWLNKANDLNKNLTIMTKITAAEALQSGNTHQTNALALIKEAQEEKQDDTQEALIKRKTLLNNAKDQIALSAYYFLLCRSLFRAQKWPTNTPLLQNFSPEESTRRVYQIGQFLDNYADAHIARIEKQLTAGVKSTLAPTLSLSRK